jgi:Tol biopolymer transport system component
MPVLFFWLLVSACGGAPSSSTASGSGTGWIAFTSSDAGPRDVFIIPAISPAKTERPSEPIQLTDNPTDDGFAAWSPDGTRIAFVSDRNGNADIFVVDVTGALESGEIPEGFPITENPAEDFFPSWSPDGTKIAFLSNRDGDFEIYLINVGSAMKGARDAGLAKLTENNTDEFYVVWSPDGSQLAFQTSRDGNFEIYRMNTDGLEQKNLTNNPAGDGFPDWSPDGDRISFSTDRDRDFEIYVMNTDGSGQINLTNNPADDQVPSWSPDGAFLAFATNRDGNFEIYVMNNDGSGLVRLTDSSADEQFPAWQP